MKRSLFVIFFLSLSILGLVSDANAQLSGIKNRSYRLDAFSVKITVPDGNVITAHAKLGAFYSKRGLITLEKIVNGTPFITAGEKIALKINENPNDKNSLIVEFPATSLSLPLKAGWRLSEVMVLFTIAFENQKTGKVNYFTLGSGNHGDFYDYLDDRSFSLQKSVKSALDGMIIPSIPQEYSANMPETYQRRYFSNPKSGKKVPFVWGATTKEGYKTSEESEDQFYNTK